MLRWLLLTVLLLASPLPAQHATPETLFTNVRVFDG